MFLRAVAGGSVVYALLLDLLLDICGHLIMQCLLNQVLFLGKIYMYRRVPTNPFVSFVNYMYLTGEHRGAPKTKVIHTFEKTVVYFKPIYQAGVIKL
jgi:hypothetical protein